MVKEKPIKIPQKRWKPIRNPDPRACEICGRMFWDKSFHDYFFKVEKQSRTCGTGCRYRLIEKVKNERKTQREKRESS